ncbi:MAG: hypothetical protein ACRDJO_10480, partial [Actinomycetota bacterium]
GDELLVVGGDTWACPPNASCAPPQDPPFRDGAAFNPRTGAWRRIADAPVPLASAATAVVRGTVYLRVPGIPGQPLHTSAFLGYSVQDDAWVELPWPDPSDHVHTLTSTGERVVAVSASDEQAERPDWVFDPGTATWSPLPDDPLPAAFDRRIVSTGGRLVLFGKEIAALGAPRPPPTLAAVFDVASARWQRLPDGPVTDSLDWFAEGETLVNPSLDVGDGDPDRARRHGGVLDLVSGAWAPLPDPPAGKRQQAAGVRGDRRVEFFRYRGPLLDLPSGSWQEVPSLHEGGEVEGRTVVTAGRDLFVSGGVGWSGRGDGVLLREGWLWSPG